MSLSSDLVTIAGLYADGVNLALSTVSRQVLNDGKRLSEIARGAGITTRRYEEVMSWFSERWPDECAWPAGIPRP